MAPPAHEDLGHNVRIAQPFNDLKIEERIISLLRSGKLVQGELVNQFEKALATYLGCRKVVALNSGTAAIHVALESLKLLSKVDERKERLEVITSPVSFAATANAVMHAGCEPVFVDVDAETFNIDPDLIDEKVNPQTLAIEPVDVYGLPAELEVIQKIGNKHGVPVVEDAAEAIGSTYNGKKIGSISTVSCFSTYATKNLHTGEGGFISTNNDAVAEKAILIRNQGQVERYLQTTLGYNFRMLEMCAAIGLEQVDHLDEFNQKRRENVRFLMNELGSLDCLTFQRSGDFAEHACYMFGIILDEKRAGISRDKLVSELNIRGVEADTAWPRPIHLQPYYMERFGFRKGDFPKAEAICSSVFQLPIQPNLTEDQLRIIIMTVREVLRKN